MEAEPQTSSLHMFLTKKAVRAHQKYGNGDHIDEKGAAFRPNIFTCRVDDTEDDGGQKGTAQTAKPANNDDNQKQNQIIDSEGGR